MGRTTRKRTRKATEELGKVVEAKRGTGQGPRAPDEARPRDVAEVRAPDEARPMDVRQEAPTPAAEPSRLDRAMEAQIQSGQNALGNNVLPAPVPSIHADLGFHVSENIKNKIISGQYVDLGSLLDMQLGEPETRTLEFSQSGQLVMKPMLKSKTISTIEMWSDAFLVYASIFLAAHPHRVQEILKYMNVVRLAAKQHPGTGWRSYDQQFRLRLATDPTGISFARIDYELWLLYIGGSSVAYPKSNILINSKKCYDYNYRQCFKMQCTFKHACINCNGAHPSNLCNVNRNQGHGFTGARQVRASASQGQRMFGPRFYPDVNSRKFSPKF